MRSLKDVIAYTVYGLLLIAGVNYVNGTINNATLFIVFLSFMVVYSLLQVFYKWAARIEEERLLKRIEKFAQLVVKKTETFITETNLTEKIKVELKGIYIDIIDLKKPLEVESIKQFIPNNIDSFRLPGPQDVKDYPDIISERSLKEIVQSMQDRIYNYLKQEAKPVDLENEA